MKIPHILLLSLLTFVLFSACKKEAVTERKVTGQVLEYGTNSPIENAVVEISACITDNGSTSCQFDQRILTDASGSFSADFNIEDVSRYALVTVTANQYFPSTEYILNPGRDNELEVVLDPHAWLSLRVRNLAPAEEFDKIFISSLISPNPGSSEEYIGPNVDLNYIIKKQGNRDLRLGWNTYDSGILIERFKDTMYIPAHDTLYYEINY